MELKRLRKEAGLTQRELAERVNVTLGYISHLEKGIRKNPSLDLVERIAAVLDVPIAELLDRKVG